MKKTYILLILSMVFLSAGLSQCDDSEVELWGDCYNIEETTYLDLSNSGLTGEIQSEIGNLTNLTFLNLYSNQLTGEIPPEIGNLTNLTFLSLYTNQLTGEIPPEIGNLNNLTVLYLGYNQLTGEIPPEIGNITNLVWLMLNDNQHTGEIPPSIGNLTNLERLSLTDNQLIGDIPSEIRNLINLGGLGLSSNQLTGEILSDIGDLTNLTELRLHSNQFTGEIPSTIGNLTNLYDLNLHSNQFTGEIPSTIGNLTNLYNLNLHSNQLTREIPEEICNQGDSTPSIVNNKLCPPYPECIEDYVGYQDTTNCSFVSVTINNLSGWNLTGLPLNVENPDYLFLFPSAVEGTLYSFDDGYNLEANLMQGEGYWLRFNESGNTTISGTPINELTISLNEGWNLIPGISTPIEISAIQDPDEIIIFGTVYEFTSGGYLNTDNIEPGKGYWIRTNGSGSITLIGD